MKRAKISADETADKRRYISENPRSKQRKSTLSAEDRKNLAEVKMIKAKVAKHLERSEFHLAAETVYHYVWHTFADKVIEDYKSRLTADNKADAAAAYATLETILFESIKMLHPFMPFITEEIYQKFLPAEALAKRGKPEKMLMVEKW